MNAELKTKWIEALRSGEYIQGTGELCSLDPRGHAEHCCLGVLAEIAGVDRMRLVDKDYLDKVGLESILGEWNGDRFVLYQAEDSATHTTTQRKLAAMNDTGHDFPVIADWIDANVPTDAS